ncbi:MAG TPA: hypothetical protein VHM26_16835, partial [Chitinophagaceae bacterium]|nr:hypothetical protein [Chitinophagaceae bacterium]
VQTAAGNSNNAGKTDSLSRSDSSQLLRTLKYQQDHPAELYKNKSKNKWIGIVLGLLLVPGLGLFLLFNTSLGRDQSYDPQTNQLRPYKERPFSYSKLQLFWWTMIVLTCFAIFFFYTWFLAAFTPTMVLLLGGGLAVSIFGKVIDNTQMQQDSGAVPSRHQDIEPSKGLLTDILSDDTGISIHRFQSVILNVLFGIGFIVAFCQNMSASLFPFIDFENWQLALLGVSSGAYLGFKTNENPPATKEKRQIEAVRTIQENTNESIGTQSIQPPTRAYETMKSNLQRKGLINEEPEQPVVNDQGNLNQ